MSLERSAAQNVKAPAAGAEREPNTIYQGAKPVARVLDAEIDLEAREIRFGEIYSSDDLLLSEECDFQKYTILIQRIGYASKVEKESEEKGRVLRGVAAEILRFREQ